MYVQGALRIECGTPWRGQLIEEDGYGIGCLARPAG